VKAHKRSYLEGTTDHSTNHSNSESIELAYVINFMILLRNTPSVVPLPPQFWRYFISVMAKSHSSKPECYTKSNAVKLHSVWV